MTCSIWPNSHANQEKRIRQFDDIRKAFADAPSMFLVDAWHLFLPEMRISSLDQDTNRAFILQFARLLATWKRAGANPMLKEVAVYLGKAVVWYQAFYDKPSGSNLKKLEILRLALLAARHAELDRQEMSRGYTSATRMRG
jgi:hypothetical protein